MRFVNLDALLVDGGHVLHPTICYVVQHPRGELLVHGLAVDRQFAALAYVLEVFGDRRSDFDIPAAMAVLATHEGSTLHAIGRRCQSGAVYNDL